jgi:hypothetical protein
MNIRVPEESTSASRLSIERWQGLANAAAVAFFGMPLVNPTNAARAAWLEVSQRVVGFSLATSRPRKQHPKI